MSLKDRLHIKLNPAFYWRMAFWASCIAIVAFASLVWLGASQETVDAGNAGRRIIIRLADGSFEKAPLPDIVPESPAGEPTATPTATETPSAETPAAATDTSHVTVTATPTARKDPETPATATPTAQAAPVEPPPAEAPIPKNSATVPLNPIKDTLREKLSIGTLPVIGSDGTKPWRYYAKPYALQGNHPMVAILVTGLGQNKNVTTAAIKLPENISLSFSPYAKDVGTWSNSARATGHEVMLDLPMEPSNYPASDPGPHGLLAGKSAEDNATQLQWLMGRIQGYTGFVTPNNEVYSQNDPNFKNTLELLNVRGLMLVMPHEPVRKETKQLLNDSKIAYTLADVMLDEELSSEAIQARFTALEKIASKHGFAMAYTRGIPLTIQEIAAWSDKLESRGFTLVPVTYITSHQFKQ